MIPIQTETWRLARLRNLTVKIGSGATPRGGKQAYAKDGIALIRSLNVHDFSFQRDGLAFIDNDQAAQLANVEVQVGDVLLNITGASVARCCMVPASVLPARVNQHVSIVRANPSFLDSRYLLYCLNSSMYKNRLLALTHGGATREALTKDTIGDFEISLPQLDAQRKIAAILSAYDDLIENNNRRIKILEEMARLIYREWFVNFRFPGYKKVRMVDSPLVNIPVGWEFTRLADACHLVMGQSPKSEFYNEEEEGLPFHQGVTNFGNRFPTHRVYCTVENRIAEVGDILFSVRAPVGRINISNTRIVIGRGLAAIRHRLGYQWFTFHQLKERFKEEDTMGGGTIFKAVTKKDMENIEFLNPTQSVIDEFEAHCRPIEKEIENLARRNQILRLTRDMLLPKLISGELDVSELDIEIGGIGA